MQRNNFHRQIVDTREDADDAQTTDSRGGALPPCDKPRHIVGGAIVMARSLKDTDCGYRQEDDPEKVTTELEKQRTRGRKADAP